MDHSAPGPAAGFEHQRQLALVLLCEAYPGNPSVRVRLEAVEDIDVVSDDVSIDARVQVKHHLAKNTLTDATPELWRTLSAWIDLVEALPPESLPQLHLATTSVAAPSSGVSMLGPIERNVEAALERLLEAARDSSLQNTGIARGRFLALETATQLRLLRAITILDSTARVTDLHDRLRRALGLVVPSERPNQFLERLQGWWVGRSTLLLAREIDHISGGDLYRFCDALRDEFRRGTLIAGVELQTDPTEEQKAPLRDRVFVRQLKMVMATNEALDLAVRHYFRAFAQRGKWVRDLEDVEDDLLAYERRLRDEWEIAHVALRSRVGPDEEERWRAGLEFSNTFGGTTGARLRGLDEPVLCRGTLHGLADGLHIGWHPDFQKRVSELLEGL